MVSGALQNPINSLTGLTGSSDELRDQFIAQLLAILGDTRLLWLPEGTDTTTSTDKSLNENTITWDATVAARLSALGLGYSQSFSGTGQFGAVPDAANLSFGDGSADEPFSVVVLANVTDTAAARGFCGKWNAAGTQREWFFNIGTGDQLTLNLYDESADVQPSRASDGTITQGAVGLFAGVYSAATGGATAANDITLYENGLAVASTASNNASYVAMENGTSPLHVGSRGPSAELPMNGSMALMALCQKALTASEIWAIKTLCNGYFSLSL